MRKLAQPVAPLTGWRSRNWDIRLLLLLSCVLLWRVHLWERVPGYGGGAPALFVSENALQYRYLRMVANGRPLPVRDRALQYPEGVAVYRDLALGMEYAEGALFRLLHAAGMRAPLWAFVRWPVAALSLLGVIACYAAGIRLGYGRQAAFWACALYALHFPAFGRTIGAYGREHFALPFILAGFTLCGLAAERSPDNAGATGGTSSARRLALAGGGCWAVALGTWHVSGFALLVMAGYLLLRGVLAPAVVGAGRTAAVLLAWCLAASLLHPMLRAHWFVFSRAMLLLVCASTWGWLATRLGRPGAVALLLAACCLGFIFRWALMSGPPVYTHVTALLLAKLAHPLAPPMDPSAIPFAARALWNEAFTRPNAFVVLYGYLPLLVPGLLGACLLLRDRLRGGDRRHDWILFCLAVFGCGFALVIRVGVFFGFFLALAAGRALVVRTVAPPEQSSSLSGYRGAGRRRLLLLPCLLLSAWQTLHYRLPDEPWRRLLARFCPPPAAAHLPGGGREWQRVVRWLGRRAGREQAVVAEFGAAPTILLATGLPIVLQPKFEVTGAVPELESFYGALYADEAAFHAWCDRRRAAYVVVSPETVLLSGPGSPSWIAGYQRPPAASAAVLMHFHPQRLSRFALVYQNSRYRVYRVMSPRVPPPAPRVFLQRPRQPLYDPDFFGLRPGSMPTPRRIASCLALVLQAEATAARAVRLARNGKELPARNLLVRALRRHPGLPLARSLLARLALRAGKPSVAREAAEEGARNDPDLPEAWQVLAAARHATGDAAGAAVAARRAVELLGPRAAVPSPTPEKRVRAR